MVTTKLTLIEIIEDLGFEQPTREDSDQHAIYFSAMRSGNGIGVECDVKAVPDEEDDKHYDIWARQSGLEDWHHIENTQEYE
jgi:hypothetical protein